MKTLSLSVIAIACFCAISFVIIPLNLDSFCMYSNDPGTSHYDQCESMIQNLRNFLILSSGIGITAIICMTYFISRKISAIIYIGSIGILVLFFIMSYFLNSNISSVPSGEMRSVSPSYQWGMHFIQSPMWNSLFATIFTSTIVWPIIIFRNKIRKVIR
jgi:hypothetical protein